MAAYLTSCSPILPIQKPKMFARASVHGLHLIPPPPPSLSHDPRPHPKTRELVSQLQCVASHGVCLLLAVCFSASRPQGVFYHAEPMLRAWSFHGVLHPLVLLRNPYITPLEVLVCHKQFCRCVVGAAF